MFNNAIVELYSRWVPLFCSRQHIKGILPLSQWICRKSITWYSTSTGMRFKEQSAIRRRRNPGHFLTCLFLKGRPGRKVVCFCTEYFPMRIFSDNKSKFVTLKLLSGQKLTKMEITIRAIALCPIDELDPYKSLYRKVTFVNKFSLSLKIFVVKRNKI